MRTMMSETIHLVSRHGNRQCSLASAKFELLMNIVLFCGALLCTIAMLVECSCWIPQEHCLGQSGRHYVNLLSFLDIACLRESLNQETFANCDNSAAGEAVGVNASGGSQHPRCFHTKYLSCHCSCTCSVPDDILCTSAASLEIEASLPGVPLEPHWSSVYVTDTLFID